MVLSDRDIRREIASGNIVINPLDEGDIQPASVDLHLAEEVLVFHNRPEGYVDVRADPAGLTRIDLLPEKGPRLLHPGEFLLGGTVEDIHVPAHLVARLEGKSSLGRIGLIIHSTAGFVDPGWQGKLTLELGNISRLPITLYRNMKIGQLSFLRLTSPAERLYGDPALGSRYQGQMGATASRSHLDYQNDLAD